MLDPTVDVIFRPDAGLVLGMGQAPGCGKAGHDVMGGFMFHAR